MSYSNDEAIQAGYTSNLSQIHPLIPTTNVP